VVPIHGEYRHLVRYRKIAGMIGYPSNHIFLMHNGDVLEMTAESATMIGQVQAGRVMIDGLGVGDIGTVVLRDRKHLSEDGIIIAITGIDSQTGSVVAGPDIITRGFIYVKESEDMMRELKDIIMNALTGCASDKITDFASLKGSIKADLSNYLYKKTKRNPMILPIFTKTIL
jgi:ribonuclease J